MSPSSPLRPILCGKVKWASSSKRMGMTALFLTWLTKLELKVSVSPWSVETKISTVVIDQILREVSMVSSSSLRRQRLGLFVLGTLLIGGFRFLSRVAHVHELAQ